VADLAEVKSILEKALPGAQVTVRDLTGGGDHLAVTVAALQFEGLGLVEQHQIIYAALKDRMLPASQEIHALQIRTSIPER